MIANKVVVGIGDPETCWRLVGVKEAPRYLCHNNKITTNLVMPLNGVLYEHCVTHHIEKDVVGIPQIVASVNGQGSVVTPMHSNTFDVRVVDISDHMEVDCISSIFECLPHVKELAIGNLSGE